MLSKKGWTSTGRITILHWIWKTFREDTGNKWSTKRPLWPNHQRLKTKVKVTRPQTFLSSQSPPLPTRSRLLQFPASPLLPSILIHPRPVRLSSSSQVTRSCHVGTATSRLTPTKLHLLWKVVSSKFVPISFVYGHFPTCSIRLFALCYGRPHCCGIPAWPSA